MTRRVETVEIWEKEEIVQSAIWMMNALPEGFDCKRDGWNIRILKWRDHESIVGTDFLTASEFLDRTETVAVESAGANNANGGNASQASSGMPTGQSASAGLGSTPGDPSNAVGCERRASNSLAGINRVRQANIGVTLYIGDLGCSSYNIFGFGSGRTNESILRDAVKEYAQSICKFD